MNEKLKNLIADYVIKLTDETIKPQELEELNAVLSSDPQAAKHYNRLMMMIYSFQECGNEIISDNKSANLVLKKEFWQAFAEDEKTAPVVEVVVPQEPKIMIQKVQHQKLNRKIRKSSLFTLFAAAAAIVLIFVFARFAPQETGLKVAVLSDSIHAKWADMDGAMEKGAPVFTSRKSLLLREGIVELLFNNQARVTIESPAEFEIVTGDQVKLNYGRLYAAVPQSAIGFAVQTSSARIIDLGTEFGIQADVNGSAELHVIKGKVQLFTGSDGKSRISQMLMENTAVRYDAALNQVKNISVEKQAFVRQIDSTNGFIWRGQTKYNLADVVGGGDGFGNGRINFGIDHEGKTDLLDNIIAYTDPVPFTSVSSNPFVDGVFVPYGPTQIDSSGEDTYDFGSTSGGFYLGILNGAWHKQRDNAVPRHALRLGGLEYGTGEHPAIYIHANQGITFDLMAIREYTQMEIDKFTAVCGVSETYADYAEAIRKVRLYKNVKLPKASFYILVDGRERLIRNDITYLDGPAVISVDIAPQDRFLTLATTESSDKNEGDWTLFGEPVLMLQSE